MSRGLVALADVPRLEAELRLKALVRRAQKAQPDAASLHWRDWLARYFAAYTWAAPAPRHVRAWDWFESLTPDVRPRPRVEAWPRAGGKSSTVELGCTRVGATGRRRYVLYCSETQSQADRHVQAIASQLEQLGIGRAVNEYGTSRGWRREELRTSSGFNVTAFGLDVGMRGVKLDQFRPDLIVIDDFDSLHDSPAVRQRKIEVITNTILPAGATDCAVLVVQNLVSPDSIMAQLVDGRADFLTDREVFMEPAVEALDYALTETSAGPVYRITAGTPTWAGQNLAVCEQQMQTWGLTAFLAEAQHDIRARAGAMVKREDFPIIARPPLCWPRVRYWDIAGTEPLPGTDPDFSAGALVQYNPPYYDVLDIAFTRAAPAAVRALLRNTARLGTDGFNLTKMVVEQEPGGQSPHFMHYLRTDVWPEYAAADLLAVDRVSRSKEIRSQPVADLAGRQLIRLVEGEWNQPFLDQAVAFPNGRHDDLWDVVVGGVNWLARFAVGQDEGSSPGLARRRTAGY